MEGLLNEFHRSVNDGDIENKLLCLKIKINSKKQSVLSQQKTLKTALTSRKEEDGASVSSLTSRNDGDYPRCSKLPANEKKANVSLMIRKKHLSLNPKLNFRKQPEGLSTQKTMSK
uniref:Uncharacterized protein n=1 Tax=Glossina pallidipes TaxID=7398 RepID=A0A1A9ZYP1_GLOPL